MLPEYESSKPHETINFTEQQRRDAIKKRVKEAASKKSQPQLTEDAQKAYAKAKEAESVWGQNKNLVPSQSKPLTGAARSSKQTMYEKLFNNSIIEKEEKLPKQMQSKLLKYRQAISKQGIKGEQLEQQVDRYRQALIYDAHKKQNKLNGQRKASEIAKNRPKEPGKKVKPSRAERLREIRNNPEKRARYNKLKLALNSELKARYERFSKFKKIKGLKKAGKLGAVIGLGVAAIGAGIALFKGCSKSKDEKPVQEVEEIEVPEQTQTPETPEEQAPEEVPAVPEPETTSKEYEVKKGDIFWNIAKKNLIDKYKAEQEAKGEPVDENYKPTNSEILAETDRIMRKNRYDYDENHYFPKSMLHSGVKIDLAA